MVIAQVHVALQGHVPCMIRQSTRGSLGPSMLREGGSGERCEAEGLVFHGALQLKMGKEASKSSRLRLPFCVFPGAALQCVPCPEKFSYMSSRCSAL